MLLFLLYIIQALLFFDNAFLNNNVRIGNFALTIELLYYSGCKKYARDFMGIMGFFSGFGQKNFLELKKKN